jgi:hypothetical protein
MTVTSSLNEITMDQLGKMVVVRGGGGQVLARLHPLIRQASKLKDRDDIPLLLERKKQFWFEWNLRPHATHWLATRLSGAAANWF